MVQQTVQKTSPIAQTQSVQKPSTRATTQAQAAAKPAGAQQPQTLTPAKKSIFKKWWFWLIICLGILIVILGFWYFFLR